MRLKSSDSVCNAKKNYSNQAMCKRTQQLLTMLRQKCCVLLSPCCSGVQTDTTTPYNMQQGVQTDETCKIQQCCVRLHGVLNQLRGGNKITKTDSLGEGFLNGCTNQVI